MILLANCGFLILSVGCVFQDPVVMCCLIWAIAVLILGICLFCYLCKKAQLKLQEADNERKHEIDLKNLAIYQEEYWFFQKKLEPKFEKDLKDKINELKKEKEDLSKQLKEEKENREKTLKEERLKAEHDFFKKFLSHVYTAKEKPSNK